MPSRGLRSEAQGVQDRMMEGVSWSAPAVPGSSSSLEEETHSSHILTLQMGKLRPRERCELSEGTSGFPGGETEASWREELALLTGTD